MEGADEVVARACGQDREGDAAVAETGGDVADGSVAAEGEEEVGAVREGFAGEAFGVSGGFGIAEVYGDVALGEPGHRLLAKVASRAAAGDRVGNQHGAAG